ncbi:MAG: GDP-mannose 4,6-dehydratase [Phycisphaerales bacterium]|nr:GDP-mannose 4,6-dehydratase [Phycisphaerales bacterium]
MGQTVLVTGAAGFIGSHVCAALLGRGDHVVGFDNFDPFYSRVLKEANLIRVRTAARAGSSGDAAGSTARDACGGFELVEGDITDSGAVRAVFSRHKPAGVIHLAARAGVRPSIADPAGYARTNVTGTAVVLEAAREAMDAGCTRCIVASSSSVYGNCPSAPFGETMDVSEPISPYAATKRACELMGYTHWHLCRMPTAMLRFFTVYGPAQRPDLAISRFLSLVSRGEPITMFGNGQTSRDYTYVDDIAAGVLAAYDRVVEGGHGYRVWNLGNSAPVTLNDMIKTVERVVGKRAVIRNEPASMGDVERTFADLTRSRHELGFSPRVGFEEGVARQWAFDGRTG